MYVGIKGNATQLNSCVTFVRRNCIMSSYFSNLNAIIQYVLSEFCVPHPCLNIVLKMHAYKPNSKKVGTL